MFTKRFIAILFSMVLFIGNVSAFASTQPNSENTEAIIVSERTYYDEDLEAEVREVITYEPVYEKSNNRNIVGSGHYTKSNTYTWMSGEEMVYYVGADFEWNDDEDYIYAYNPISGVYNQPASIAIINTNRTISYGQYFFFFNKYVDVDFSFQSYNMIGSTKDFSISIRVSQTGSVS